MPSGITSAIYDGTDLSLRSYLIRVARQMGDFIHLRDHGGAELSLRPESAYHADALAEARKHLDALERRTAYDWKAATDKHNTDECRAYERACQRQTELQGRYTQMLAQVEAWDCPDEVIYMKKHAERFLRESMDFDLHTPPAPKLRTPGEHTDAELTAARNAIKYHAEKAEAERQRTQEFNAKIAVFLAALPQDKETGEKG